MNEPCLHQQHNQGQILALKPNEDLWNHHKPLDRTKHLQLKQHLTTYILHFQWNSNVRQSHCSQTQPTDEVHDLKNIEGLLEIDPLYSNPTYPY